MKSKLKFLFIGIYFFLNLVACSGDYLPIQPYQQESLPIVMVHGALASGDTYANFGKYFLANGVSIDHLYTFDWNSTGSSSSVNELDKFIDEILMKTGKSQVFLIGHSAGGGLCYNYCNVALNASKVAKYVHLASNPQSKLAGNNGQIMTLNIFSKADKIVNGGNIPMAKNIELATEDHYEVATSLSAFVEVYNFLFLVKPQITEFIFEQFPKIWGKVVSLGENKPTNGALVSLYNLDEKGDRIGAPIYSFKIDETGKFGPINLENRNYEFEVTKEDPAFRTIHYYKEKIYSDNPFVYLRVFPPSNTIAGGLLSALPSNDEQSVIGVFSASKAIIEKRDSLIIQKQNLSNSSFCKPSDSTIAMFLYDNGDGKSKFTSHLAFSFIPFLKGADVFFGTACSETVPIKLNERILNIKNFKSKSEGVSIAIFD